jgi:hypothetical protein
MPPVRELGVRPGEPPDAAGTANTGTLDNSAPAPVVGSAGRALKVTIGALQAGPVLILVLRSSC